MDTIEIRELVTRTGLALLKDGLVARTWGNVSARVDDTHYVITPSGLDYTKTTVEDLALMDMTTGQWSGPRKPSSEKGVHTAAYEIFEDVQFVIHTHQVYATAIGVSGFDKMILSEEERRKLGGIALAEYGLPGTKKLTENVRKAMMSGAHTILMQHHGVLIAGSSKEDAYEKIQLLENLCRKAYRGALYPVETVQENESEKAYLLETIRKTYPLATWEDGWAARRWSMTGEPLVAQIDDMAMMIGRKIPVVKNAEKGLKKALEESHAAFVAPFGAIVCGGDEDDTEALGLLVDKAAMSMLHSRANREKNTIGILDCQIMHMVYKNKYSKQKNSTSEE